VTRYSKYCDTHYKYRERPKKKSLFGFLTDIKDRVYKKRVKYDEEGNIIDMNTKGFRKGWFWR
jgi:hypothetical protein